MSRCFAAIAFVLIVGVVPYARGRAQTAEDLARETLPPNDGWGSFSTGTTGGSAATPDRTFTATNRNELVAALANGSAPRIVFVSGTIDANVDANQQPLGCGAYEAPGYSLAAYLAAYDPATWGRQVPTGPLENARRASQTNQQARIRINIPANTTLIGLEGATIVGAHLRVNNADNVIIRNLTLLDAHDCFPAWDPTDGATGNWNSAYDNLSLLGATHIWVDHCTFGDGDNPDRNQPVYFGRPFQGHDGELDITNASDLVTVSWDRFADHDKVMLIGSSDSATADIGKLRVTLHHNVFANVIQRMPRVRFGQVHVFNNYYDVADTENYGYSWGVGIQSQISAQNNFFRAGTISPTKFISVLNGTMVFATGTIVYGQVRPVPIDVVSAYNATHNPDVTPKVAWTPLLFNTIDPTPAVPGLVTRNAGVFHEDF